MNGIKVSGGLFAAGAFLAGVAGASFFFSIRFGAAGTSVEHPEVTLLKSDKVEARIKALEEQVEGLLAKEPVQAPDSPDWNGVAEVVSAAHGGEVVLEQGDMKIVVGAIHQLMGDASQDNEPDQGYLPAPVVVGGQYLGSSIQVRRPEDFVKPEVGGSYVAESFRLREAFTAEVERLSESGLTHKVLMEKIRALEAQFREDLKALAK